MSRSKRDQRGKRINGEIGGLPKIVGDTVRNDFGWEPTGNPNAKKSAKQAAGRMRRRVSKDELARAFRAALEIP